MSKSMVSRVQTLFVGATSPEATPIKTVIRTAEGSVRPTLSAAQLELEQLRAENTRLKNAQPKAKAKPESKIETTLSFENVNGTKCVVLKGAFKPLYISEAKWNILSANVSGISNLFKAN